MSRVVSVLLFALGNTLSLWCQTNVDTLLLQKQEIGSYKYITGSFALLSVGVEKEKVSGMKDSVRLIYFRLSNKRDDSTHRLYALLTKHPEGSLSIAFDCDFDDNFEEERPYEVSDSSGKLKIDCNIGLLLNLKFPFSDTVSYIEHVKWLPLTCTSLKVNDGDTVYAKYAGAIYPQELLIGKFVHLEKPWNLIVQNSMFELTINEWKHPRYLMLPSSDTNTRHINGIKYRDLGRATKIDSVVYTPTTLIYQPLSLVVNSVVNHNPMGVHVGFSIDPGHEYRTITGATLALTDARYPYTLLEFWGTWCGPCVALYPKFSSMLDRHATSLRYVGVALDKNPELVSEYIKAKPLISQQLFVKMQEGKGSIVDQFAVENFPTFVLIDQDGKIVFRETGTDGFEKLQQFLNEALK